MLVRREYRWNKCRAVAIVEGVVGVVVVALFLLLLLGLILPSLGGKHANLGLKCETQLSQLFKAMTLWSQDHGGEFAVPTVLDQATAARCAQRGDSTSNVHSVLIHNLYYTPQLTVCPLEANQWVTEDTDYDYGNSPGNSATKLSPSDTWDYDFSCDITGAEKSARTGKWRSNVSYANLGLAGQRMKNQWRDVLDSHFLVMSDRGPMNGMMISKSQSAKNHSDGKWWAGNVVYGDGHADFMKQRQETGLEFVLPGMEKSVSGKPDNIFADDDPVNGSDIYLSVWGDCIDGNIEALWD